MEKLEDYRARLVVDGLVPFNKLIGVVECRLNRVAENEGRLRKRKDFAFFSALALVAAAAIIVPFEDQPFVALLPGVFGVFQAVTWYCRRAAQERIAEERMELERLLYRANFEVNWLDEGARESPRTAIKWKKKEARFYA